MAKDNIYSVLQKPVAKHGRNSFNLNNQHVYSMKAGQIIPVKAIHFMPNDYLRMKAKDFSITFPMNSAPFLRARKEFSFYSVYYSAVWSLFNQYMAGRQDPKTSAFGIQPVLQEPRIKLLNLFAGVLNQFGAYLFLDHYVPTCIKNLDPDDHPFIVANADEFIRMAKDNFFNDEYSADYFYQTSIGYQGDIVNFSLNLANTAPFNFDAFEVASWNVIEQQGHYNDKVYLDVVGHYRVYNQLRKLDMLGYGNYYPRFREIENQISTICELYSAGTYSWEQFNSAFVGRLVELAQLLVVSFATWNSSIDVSNLSESDITSYKMVNLYPLCSYNSIFYHFFRNSFYDNGYFSHDYSLDFVSAANGGSGYNEVTLHDFSNRFLDIEYHQWKKDMFTSVLPDEQYGAVSSISLNVNGTVPVNVDALLTGNTGSDIGRWQNSDGTTPSTGASVSTNYTGTSLYSSVDSKTLSHSHVINGTATISSSGTISASTMFDMIALKRAEMLQEYRQTLMRAGNKTSDVFRALYGGAPSSEHEDDIIPRFLETFGEDLVVDPVISTADTGQPTNGALGDIAARGKTSGESNSFNFDAGDNFGCIICLAYIVPSAMYNSYMLDKHLLELSPEQHFIPNFENIGLEDIYSDELNIFVPANDLASLGKQARYYHKKTDIDKVHGAFCSVSRDLLINGVREEPVAVNKLNYFFGDFNHWVSVRTEMQGRGNTLLRDFYINPSVLDNVFVRAAGADQADDQFLCTTLLEVDATKAISKTGFVNFV